MSGGELARLAGERDRLQTQCDDLQRRYIDTVARYRWALAVGTELARCPRGMVGFLLQCLPHGIWRLFQSRALKRKGLFDVQAYRRRFRDSERSRFGPLAHFLRWGVIDGRPGGPDRPDWRTQSYPAELIDQILQSGLFDHTWYCTRYGFAGTPEEAVRDYLEVSAADPLRDPGPLFSGAFYVLQNPDTVQVNPLRHYLSAGRAEGRRAFSPVAADAFLRDAKLEPLVPIEEMLDPAKPCVVLCWDRGNFFFNDIADYVRRFLANRGYLLVELSGENAPDPAAHNVIVVAPHEYCIHGPGRDWSATLQQAAIYLNTEQWHTSWFSLAFSVMAKSSKVLDLNPASARGLCRLGFLAGFLPIVPLAEGPFVFPSAPVSATVASFRAIKPLTHPRRFEDRPYDCLYVAALNDRRAGILASLAPTLAKHDCFIHSPALNGPVKADSPNMISAGDCAQLARNAKILLNIHQGESHYFEWHRLFLTGIWEGCVVVTEPCIDTGVLLPGVHYLEVEADRMAGYLDWLLTTADGRRVVADIHAECLDLRRRLETRELVIA